MGHITGRVEGEGGSQRPEGGKCFYCATLNVACLSSQCGDLVVGFWRVGVVTSLLRTTTHKLSSVVSTSVCVRR